MKDSYLTIQKLEDMLGAHNDGVYRLSARGDDFAVDLARQLLATMKRVQEIDREIRSLDKMNRKLLAINGFLAGVLLLVLLAIVPMTQI